MSGAACGRAGGERSDGGPPGLFFTVDVRVHPDQTVVVRGPYRFVRHPSYTGLILFVGVGLALTDWASPAVPTAKMVVRIHSEERALLAALGDDYRRRLSSDAVVREEG